MLGVLLLSAVVGYLCGSVPFGYLIGKFNGIDIRRHGSCNIGATNVTRVLGKGWGRACFVCDFLKGYLPVLAAAAMAVHSGTRGGEWVPILTAAGCVCGHMFSVFLNFSGGKGVATSIGALLALAPVAILAAVMVWLVVFFVTRYVSLASISAAIMMPLNALMLNIVGKAWCHSSWPVLLLLAVVALLIVVRHHGNIQRLMAGTEHRFTKKQA